MGALTQALAHWSRRHALRPVVFGSACCASELAAALGPFFGDGGVGLLPQAEAPVQADLLIVAGRLSTKVMPLLQQTYCAMVPPRWVLAFGACAISGGLFGTYAVAPGTTVALPSGVPVDVHVPGCPPHPGDLRDGLDSLRQRMKVARPR